ncbi:SulP family inorganic anion transporter [Pelagibaculum spongiae]|uniref:Sodium-independent anion transporter n=1 Tax=Pelagibaculum spongiae TaxID=2080658 RepID=A0A2V1GYJ9_9GAMM|nr:SulP family inorganic anion transporter [Pelagibaculum spongiae]PVZ68126.1 sodium-independent anion transporter [Pelagibaculum spongiae]
MGSTTKLSRFSNGDFSKLIGDLFGGLTAAIVALPLALAFGVSSGLGAVAGLYGAIGVGFFAAIFGGTKTQISGPTGPMTVVMVTILAELNHYASESSLVLAFTVIMLAGVFQILFGSFKLGRYLTQMPFPVISGFMSGIGLIIIVLQLGILVGHSGASNVIQALQLLPQQLGQINLTEAGLSALCLGLLLLWPKKFNRWLPSPLLVLIVSLLLSNQLLSGELALLGEVPSGLPSLHWPVFDATLLAVMIKSALLLAVLGSLDSLLTSLVADNMTRTQHNSNKELIGQGIGNIAAGFLGGLPGAGATMRTVVNIRAGGNSRISGILHSLILLAIALGAGGLTEQIPQAALAAILVKVGIDIIDWNYLKRLHHSPLSSVGLMLIVMLLTVLVDLITAVAVGVFIANIGSLDRLSRHQSKNLVITSGKQPPKNLSADLQQQLNQLGEQVVLLQLNSPITFGVAKDVSQRLNQYQNYQLLIIDLQATQYIGLTTSMMLEDICQEALRQGKQVKICGAQKQPKEILHKLRLHKLIGESNYLDNLQLAIEQHVK